jgi:hypothetical protein
MHILAKTLKKLKEIKAPKTKPLIIFNKSIRAHKTRIKKKLIA